MTNLITTGEFNAQFKFYTQDHISRNVKQHSKLKAKNYLYTTCGIIDRVIKVVETAKDVLGEDKWMDSYVERMRYKYGEMLCALNYYHKHTGNYLHSATVLNNIEMFIEAVQINILSQDDLSYQMKVAQVLNNTLLYLTLAIDSIKSADNEYWNQMSTLICDVIEHLAPDFSDELHHSCSVYDSTWRKMLGVKKRDEVLNVSNWDMVENKVFEKIKESEDVEDDVL